MKKILTVIVVLLCVVLSSCTSEPMLEIETIATPVAGFPGTAYNIQLRIDSTIFSPFGWIDTVNPSELYIPLGDKLGVAQNFTFISIFEVYEHSPNEWLYGVYDNEGGIVLFKADHLTDIPVYFYELLEAKRRLYD